MNLSSKLILVLCCAMTFMLGSCQKVAIDGKDDGGVETKTGGKVTLTVNVSQIELVPFGDMPAAKQAFSATTRTTNVADVCRHLCFALYKGGKRVKYVNQNVGTENFGTVALRIEPGTYKLLVLPRAVAKFQVVMTDTVPPGFSQIYCVYTGGGTAFNAVKGVGVTVASQYKTFGLSASDIGKSKTLEIYTFPKSEKDTLNMLVETFDAANEIQRKITLRVPIRRNMISRYSGSLFDESANATFHIDMTSADEWVTEEHSF